MIDQWIKKDLQPVWDQHPVAVLCDPAGEAEFLLKELSAEAKIYRPVDDLSELEIKYEIEKAKPSSKRILIYSRQGREGLQFIREYCETCGCLEIPSLGGYVKKKVHISLNLHINLPDSELLTAARVSVGKKREYWLDICHKGAGEIFDLAKELLPFLHAPEDFDRNRYDEQIRESFYRKVFELIKQPYVSKPPKTLAKEVVDSLFRGLLSGNVSPVLMQVYESWLDSVIYRESFQEYLHEFKLPADKEFSKVAINHPFRQIDEQWLTELASDLATPSEKSRLLPKVRQRAKSNQARALRIDFWEDILTLVEFDPQNISYLGSLTECVKFYTEHFAPLDTAIRKLYATFLDRRELLEPWQRLYRDRVTVMLEQWFRYFCDYESTQTGLLQKIMDENCVKTAIIVGDGVAFEIATEVARKVGTRYPLHRDVILADLPSETENNMSRIYIDSGLTEKIHGNREKYLRERNPDRLIDFKRLDDVGEDNLPGQYLIAAYKEIDDMGEKLQQKALKHFGAVIDFLAVKIRQLLASGYRRVYLIADHGFVLTGILSESDKIIGNAPANTHTAERYIQSNERLGGMTEMVEEERPSGGYRYLYFARNLNPFKTRGVYGFAHGGATPQEVVTPFFFWEAEANAFSGLPVTIDNKASLNSITGDLFAVKIIAGIQQSENLFTRERRAYLIFFSDGRQINKSDIFSVSANSPVQKEFSFDRYTQLELQLFDAETQELLDSATIRQKQSREFGGLL